MEPAIARLRAVASSVTSGRVDRSTSGVPDLAFLRVDVAQVLDHRERAALRPGDVHVHPHVVLTRAPSRPGRRGPAAIRAWSSAAIDVVLVERPGLGDRGLPQLERPVRPRARAARREHRAARVAARRTG